MIKHGYRYTEEYSVWLTMRNRCRNRKSPSYKNYGGRGIEVCKEWDSFEVFLSDMGKRPTTSHEIDRIDTNGNYEKINCRWVTKKENNRNRRNTRLLQFEGITLSLSEWADLLEIKASTLHNRVTTHKWSDERALSTPIRRF